MDNFKVGVYLIYKKDRISQALNGMFGDEPNHLGIIYKEKSKRKILVYPIICINPDYGRFNVDDYLKSNTPTMMKSYKIKREHKDNYNSLINSSIEIFLSEMRNSRELFLDLCKRKYLGYIILDKILTNLDVDSFADPTTFELNFEDPPRESSRLPRYAMDVLDEIVSSKPYRDAILYFFNKDYNRDDQVLFFNILNSFAGVSHKLIHIISNGMVCGYVNIHTLLDVINEYLVKNKDLEDEYSIIVQKLDINTGYPKIQSIRTDIEIQAISLVEKSILDVKIDEINAITTGLLDDIKLGKTPTLKYGLLSSKINSILAMFGRNLIAVDGISSINGVICFDEKLDQVPVLLRGGNKIIIPLNNPDKQLETCNKEQLEEILVVLDIISNGNIAYDELRSKITIMLSKI